MRFDKKIAALAAGLGLIGQALGWHPSDSVMDADSAQSGYLPNHNMDPLVIAGGTFGQIWQYKTPASFNGLAEQFVAKPLVYTPSSTGRQIVLAFSEQSRIYALDAVNGTLVAFRDLNAEGETPFLVSDLGNCNDISGTIGVSGTPIIDNTTETVYFWAKGYKNPAVKGWQNGAYRFHAIDVVTLKERPGFPTNIEGVGADNDATRRFVGGSVLQRTALNLINGYVYAGFGGHCDQYNYTGWLVGMKASNGAFATAYSTMAGNQSNPQDGTWTGGGGGAGVWMGGGAIASDHPSRLFFASANGFKQTVNGQLPARGKDHLDTASECMINMALDPLTGKATQQDYFQPYTYKSLDNGDRDLGSGGVAILPFAGGGVNRLAVTCGKNGQCYVTNPDNLGGYKMGSGGSDAILQTIVPQIGTALFGNVGAYPLEGGYLYLTPIGAPTYVYQLGSDSSGQPAFSLVGQTDEVAAGRPGVGSATITSMNGAPNSGILWIADTGSGLRAYNAVPQNGKLVRITLPPSPYFYKFQRAVFGNGRYYLTANNLITGFGSPVSLPLTCSGPLDFGSLSVGQSASKSVTCKAEIATNITGATISNELFSAKVPAGTLAKGASITIPITFNLTGYSLSTWRYSPNTVAPGVQAGSITLSTVNGVKGYSNLQPIPVSATVIAAGPFPAINPGQVDFQPVILGSQGAQGGTDNTFVVANLGQSDMNITGWAYTNSTLGDGVYTNLTLNSNGNPTFDKNGYFTATDLPPVGTTIKAGSSIVVHANFKANQLGTYSTILTVWTNGGSAYTIITGSANSEPIAKLSYATLEGGWMDVPSCPSATPETPCTTDIDMGTSVGGFTTTRLQFRISNVGGSDLIIDKSKPPLGNVIAAENPNTDFPEAMVILPGESAYGTVYFSPGLVNLNSDAVEYSGVWTLNVNDLQWGVHMLNFVGTVVGRVVGPLLPSGNPRFKYSGCYLDSTASRVEPNRFTNSNLTNGVCMQMAVDKTYAFAAIEYSTECWVGNTIPDPSRQASDTKCTTYLCPGNKNETCGGAGSYTSVFYDTLAYFPANNSLAYPYQPPTNKDWVGNYSYVGCRKDATNSRTFTYSKAPSNQNTLEICAAACKAYAYFGVEYGTQCYCGNSIGITGQSATPESDCVTPCPGNTHELCGAANRLSIYALNGTVVPPPVTTSSSTSSSTTSTTSSSTTSSSTTSSSSTSSSTKSSTTTTSASTSSSSTTTSSSTSTSSSTTSSSSTSTKSTATTTSTSTSSSSTTTTTSPSSTSSSSTSSSSTSTSSTSTSSTSTTSSSTTSLSSTSTKSTTTTTSTSTSSSSTTTTTSPSSTSTSSTSTTSSSITTSSSTTTVSTSSSSSTTTSTTTSTTSSTSTQPTGWTYLGCATDSTSLRTLNATSTTDPAMTPSMCQSYCKGKYYPVSGVEYGTQCYCGFDLAGGSNGLLNQTGCTTACGGDASQICGGKSRISITRNTTYVMPRVVQSINTPASTTGSVSLLGCFMDSSSSRTLKGMRWVSPTDITVEACAAKCATKNYNVVGVSYGGECYCDMKANAPVVGGSLYVNNLSECTVNMCTGDPTEFCGGSSRLLVWA